MLRAILLAMIVATLTTTASTAEEKHEESGDKNVVGLFIGGTTKFKDSIQDETGFTLAGEYEFIPAKWDHKWGFAGAIELVSMHELEGIIIPLVYYHATEGLFLRGGVGLEVGYKEDAESGAAYLLVRAGTGYSIPVKNLFLVPSIDFDMVRSDLSLVYGVVIAREF